MISLVTRCVIFMRQDRDHLYFTGDSSGNLWTINYEKAMTFTNLHAALRRKNQLTDTKGVSVMKVRIQLHEFSEDEIAKTERSLVLDKLSPREREILGV